MGSALKCCPLVGTLKASCIPNENMDSTMGCHLAYYGYRTIYIWKLPNYSEGGRKWFRANEWVTIKGPKASYNYVYLLIVAPSNDTNPVPSGQFGSFIVQSLGVSLGTLGIQNVIDFDSPEIFGCIWLLGGMFIHLSVHLFVKIFFTSISSITIRDRAPSCGMLRRDH